MNTYPSLSFCITCKNRLHQIRQTLRKNLDDNSLHADRIEFILVDFDSSDGLREWVIENFLPELTSYYLKYYYTKELPLWHASVAKNTAHWCASKDILVNLDCDNFTGINGGDYVMKTVAQHGDQCVIHQFSGIYGDGSFGRIAVQRKYFDWIGGYDESFDPMGHQDYDLIGRLVKIGLKYISRPDNRYNIAIPNSKEEGIAHTGSSKNYFEMLRHNVRISYRNLQENKLVANNGKFGIRKNLFDHNGKEIESQNKKY